MKRLQGIQIFPLEPFFSAFLALPFLGTSVTDPKKQTRQATKEIYMKNLKVGFVYLFLIFFVFPSGCATAPKLATESFFVPARDPGIELYVRNKRPEGVTKFEPEKIILFVHGATYNSESGFDLPLNNLSWMDYVAQRGWDVYIMDLRGYGRSTRPPEMSKPAAENPPIVNTDVAVKDVGAVVDHILARRGVPRINLLGWSWGTTIMGAYTAQNNSKVERLVLYAPLWLVKDAPPIAGMPPLGAYRTVSKEEAKKRMVRGVRSGETKGDFARCLVRCLVGVGGAAGFCGQSADSAGRTGAEWNYRRPPEVLDVREALL